MDHRGQEYQICRVMWQAPLPHPVAISLFATTIMQNISSHNFTHRLQCLGSVGLGLMTVDPLQIKKNHWFIMFNYNFFYYIISYGTKFFPRDEKQWNRTLNALDFKYASMSLIRFKLLSKRLQIYKLKCKRKGRRRGDHFSSVQLQELEISCFL